MRSVNLIVFPSVIAVIFGIDALEIGARKAWVRTPQGRFEVPLAAFKLPSDLALPAAELANKARIAWGP
jgi:hypothetical protein